MANSQDYQNQLDKLQADYLQSIKDKGQLPTVINNAYNSQEAKDLASLQGQQGQYLQKYVGSYQNARAGYQNIENPLVRDKLAAQQAQLDYAPINDIRTQLAAKAQALSALQQGAGAMYNAGLQQQQAAIGFANDSYNRSFQKEQAAQQAAYQQQQLAASRAKSSGGGSSSAAKKTANKFDEAYNYAQNLYTRNQDQKDAQGYTENTIAPDLAKTYGKSLSPDELNWILYEARKATWGS